MDPISLTPLQYHAIGALVLALTVLSAHIGPRDFRGWPRFIANDGPMVKGFALAFVFLAWPAVAVVLVLMYAVWLVSIMWRPFLLALEYTMKALCVVFYIALVGGGGYWLVVIALPFLGHWYGITG